MWMNISLALSAIYLSFVGVAIGVIISIVNTTLMKTLQKYNAEKDLVQYIKVSAIMSVVLFVVSAIFLFINYEENKVIKT